MRVKPFRIAVSPWGLRPAVTAAIPASKGNASGTRETFLRQRRSGNSPSQIFSGLPSLQALFRPPGRFSQALTLLLFQPVVFYRPPDLKRSAQHLFRRGPSLFRPSRGRKRAAPWSRVHRGIRMHPVRGIYPKS